MTKLAILCSGQGYQGPGMFDLVADAPEAEGIFAAAADVLGGHDAREIAASGSDEDLHANATAQILCCTQALAAWAVLKPRLSARIVVAGYSVGEVAAWGVAGVLEPAAVLQVVAKRAALMDAATTAASGLLAVRGLATTAVERLCEDAGVYVAIRNAPDRIVIGGTRYALKQACDAARRAGAAGLTQIPVGVPSHTPLLRDAADEFATFLHGLEGVCDSETRLLSGIDGAPVFETGDGLNKLARQVAQTVDWAACLESCRAFGATRSLELGPGDALARMMGDIIDRHDSRSTADFRSVEGVLRWVEASTADDPSR